VQMALISEPEEAIALRDVDHLEMVESLLRRNKGIVGIIRQCTANDTELSPVYLNSCMEQLEGNLVLLEKVT